MARYTFTKLNDKHIKFCERYVEHFKRQEAYQSAYPNSNSSTRSTNAKKLLDHPLIIEYVNKLKQEKLEEDKREKDKWKYKREEIINEMYALTKSKTSQDKDKIRARRVFLSSIDKYEEFKDLDEQGQEKVIRNQYEMYDKLIDEEDLSGYENIEFKKKGEK